MGFFKQILNALVIVLLLGECVQAAELRIAVASNFSATARVLVEQYSLISQDSVVLLNGSTGKHAQQIQYGLKAGVFLAADSLRPELIEQQGLSVKGSRFTYAVGRLALWSPSTSLMIDTSTIANLVCSKTVAIANPKTAPYGMAAREVMAKLGISPRLVYGESVAQAHQFASSGGAEFAFVAYSQLKDLKAGSYWLVPDDLHPPIIQQAILLNDSLAAHRFVEFLKSEAALKIIESYGYQRPILG